MPDSNISTVTDAHQQDPLWYKDAVIYQLHIKSFFDSNNDGVGDIPGLIEKLDYVAELGVDAIWMLPFYPSPRRDDGYDIADYTSVHPEYGTMDDIRRFIDAAHARGIRVITELVINHTSDQHPWFQRARNAPKGSPERDYYVWSDSDEKYDGTRIIFLDTEKSNWTWDPVAGQYFWHRFYSHQPDLNFDNPAVMEEVLSVMRFWLDLGIDGLRLDAIPYLIERDGTNNENLPETHVVLKKIRAALDEHATGRMLLAEANQWPEDTQQYFGDGDECHMSFHFPLMPRMYMAMAQEDRFPITDILRQTPEIPENCQWAIFLRNHDELTLEMVTDKERDYLWDTYAADKRARINLGIRRRLAPLLERDRRRIELMNSLLLSMPGTPVLYYGDEIGMGDNIHLGDRDGVRTPMQWSPDRNGGFSRANPASLVLPAIMDPIYGFQAVNVEAQASDPHSPLNWTRRMLAVRKRHQAFGRGSFGYLYPGNRKILAYTREYEGETILCVCNLSRTAQAVELDLASHAGKVPIELVGGASFPPIGQLTYLLTLPPYGFYWFLLATEAALPTWHTPAPEPMSELSTLVMRNSLTEVLVPPQRGTLERDALPQYLARRRWYSGKGIAGAPPVLAFTEVVKSPQAEFIIAEVEAPAAEGSARYFLPLGTAWEDENPSALVQQLALARLRRGRRVGLLTDAFALDTLPFAMLRSMADSDVVPLSEGEIRFLPTSQFDASAVPEDAEIRRLSAEQSNSSLIIGEHAVMKLVRRVTEGISPETEMTRFLTEKGFAQTAPLLGEVVRVDGAGVPRTLVVLQGFVRNQGDGWGWTLDFLSRAVESMAVTDSSEDEQQDAFAGYAVFATALGRRLAEMHALLAEPSEDEAFAPVAASEAEVTHWAEDARKQLATALDALARVPSWDNEVDAERAAWLAANRDRLMAAVDGLAKSAPGALRTRIHGDFHLGQVLVVQGDACIIDFEGEPAKTLDQRRAKTSPLRDVAGLLRSFDYAVGAALPGQAAASSAADARRGPMLESFREHAGRAFLDAYHAVHEAAPQRWAEPAAEQALLDLFLIEKAAYEICYEAANRPTWIGIPLRGLDELARRVTEKE
ncbi:maltose alpha-D-glucosyltransferase [Roseomonas haemaphysalidis]|uniref:maltose alpha-D-glucosyltransferase n=1 Tax=Roseomonas haemaphysalidis TaxID=2768162 RepID=A0ABS3KL81_9PROT|nr:maltose alpha-D-glucosyltransferase [Roseomonas haemaphysalidis]MBO1078206.1 maltose alpha-D-glucosyltransferase [Roseomonas haemaphysalidis]